MMCCFDLLNEWPDRPEFNHFASTRIIRIRGLGAHYDPLGSNGCRGQKQSFPAASRPLFSGLVDCVFERKAIFSHSGTRDANVRQLPTKGARRPHKDVQSSSRANGMDGKFGASPSERDQALRVPANAIKPIAHRFRSD